MADAVFDLVALPSTARGRDFDGLARNLGSNGLLAVILHHSRADSLQLAGSGMPRQRSSGMRQFRVRPNRRWAHLKCEGSVRFMTGGDGNPAAWIS